MSQNQSVERLLSMSGVRNSPIPATAKSLPAAAFGRTTAEFVTTGPVLGDFLTPLLVLEDKALRANVARLAEWTRRRGLGLAPHGKTTMAPQLWQHQLDAGAWGITVANPSQLRVALLFDVPRIMLANSLLDPVALADTQAHLRTRTDTQIVAWVDSVASVQAMADALDPAGPPLDVLVELGAHGGRTGARSVTQALEVAAAVRSAASLRLRGTCGYEGALAHTADAAALKRVRTYLQELRRLHDEMWRDDTGEMDEIIVTAGGSAFFDEVGDELAALSSSGPGRRRVTVLVRSGAYIVHDDGFYRGISPLSRDADNPLRSAMHAWCRVVSRPEPELALLDGGKRDLSFDEGLPEPQGASARVGGPLRTLEGAAVTQMNDQHSFLRLSADDPLRVGDVVRLGLSHPCTALDKWRIIPLVRDIDEPDAPVIDLIHTYF